MNVFLMHFVWMAPLHSLAAMYIFRNCPAKKEVHQPLLAVVTEGNLHLQEAANLCLSMLRNDSRDRYALPLQGSWFPTV